MPENTVKCPLHFTEAQGDILNLITTFQLHN